MITINDIKRVCVVGAGTMGQGIAQIVAMAGYQVVLYDINQNILQKAILGITSNLNKGISLGKVDEGLKERTLNHITTSHEIMDVTGELIIEAVLERLEIKEKLFADLESINTRHTLYASNTSSIPITQIARGLKYPQYVAGLHFFNPAHIMKLVEIVAGASTAPWVLKLFKEFSFSLGKTPVMAKDAPGFIVNRVARHYYVESLKLLEENVADVDTIDQLMESTGFPMGPFKLMDLIGVDTNFAVTSSMFKAFNYDAKFRPSRIQKQKVDAGHHGRKSAKGFYDYPG